MQILVKCFDIRWAVRKILLNLKRRRQGNEMFSKVSHTIQNEYGILQRGPSKILRYTPFKNLI